MYVFSGCKHNNLVLTFCRVCFLACVNFFAVFQLFPCLAVLLCCFLLCCFGRFLASFARFVYLVLLPFNLKVMRYHCAFLLRCYCRFCCLLGPAGDVAFFSCFPSVVMRVQQCPPCALPCPAFPTHRFPPFQNTYMLPSKPCAYTCTPFGRAHMVMSVLAFVRVFVRLLRVLCVLSCLCLRLLVCLYVCFVFAYVYVVALCA